MKIGKQAKIGITAVSAVLVAFGVIAVKNICSSAQNSKRNNSADQSPTASTGGERQTQRFQLTPGWDSDRNAPRTSPPKVVAPVRIAAKPLIESPGEGNAPGVIGGGNFTQAAGVPAQSQAPTFMPNPPKSEKNLAGQKGHPPSSPLSWKPYRPSETPPRPEPEYRR
jgi:cell division septation protein DedD